MRWGSWMAAATELNWQDQQAEYRISHGLQQAGSLLSNDQTMAYQTPDYEQTLLHHYLALSYLFMDQTSDALVEIRQANQAQVVVARNVVAQPEQPGVVTVVGQEAGQRAERLGGVAPAMNDQYLACSCRHCFSLVRMADMPVAKAGRLPTEPASGNSPQRPAER